MDKDKTTLEISVLFNGPAGKPGKVTTRHAFWTGDRNIEDVVAYSLDNLTEVVVNRGKHVTGFETRLVR